MERARAVQNRGPSSQRARVCHVHDAAGRPHCHRRQGKAVSAPAHGPAARPRCAVRYSSSFQATRSTLSALPPPVLRRCCLSWAFSLILKFWSSVTCSFPHAVEKPRPPQAGGELLWGSGGAGREQTGVTSVARGRICWVRGPVAKPLPSKPGCASSAGSRLCPDD